jgi:3-methyladenine DNA glycosylase Tag
MKIVYILINQSMPDLIKVGITDDLERRMKELDKTGTPLPFECFYAVEIDESVAPKIEKKIHEGFDDKRIRHNREFFSATPEQAKSILEIAEIMGGKDVTPKEDIVETPQDKQALENAKKQRSRFNFQMIDLKPGTILKFRKDETITCEVHDDTKIKFRDKITSLSNAAEIILKEMGYDWSAYQGPRWWMYEGKNLRDIRRESE